MPSHRSKYTFRSNDMDRNVLFKTGLAALATCLAAAILFLWVDRPVDAAAHSLMGSVWYLAGQKISLLADHDFFNVWLSVCFLIAGVLALKRGVTPLVRNLFYVCLSVSIAMSVDETLKWAFGRYRPIMLFDKGLYGFSWFASNGDMHSFPSGHTTRIFSLMTALGMVRPKERWFFLGAAVLVGASRVIVTRHYPSDVLVGAFLGFSCAWWGWRIMQSNDGGRRL